MRSIQQLDSQKAVDIHRVVKFLEASCRHNIEIQGLITDCMYLTLRPFVGNLQDGVLCDEDAWGRVDAWEEDREDLQADGHQQRR